MRFLKKARLYSIAGIKLTDPNLRLVQTLPLGGEEESESIRRSLRVQ